MLPSQIDFYTFHEQVMKNLYEQQAHLHSRIEKMDEEIEQRMYVPHFNNAMISFGSTSIGCLLYRYAYSTLHFHFFARVSTCHVLDVIFVSSSSLSLLFFPEAAPFNWLDKPSFYPTFCITFTSDPLLWLYS